MGGAGTASSVLIDADGEKVSGMRAVLSCHAALEERKPGRTRGKRRSVLQKQCAPREDAGTPAERMETRFQKCYLPPASSSRFFPHFLNSEKKSRFTCSEGTLFLAAERSCRPFLFFIFCVLCRGKAFLLRVGTGWEVVHQERIPSFSGKGFSVQEKGDGCSGFSGEVWNGSFQ